MAALERIPEHERAPVLTALDAFLGSPTPASFLAATRVIDAGLRELVVARAAVGLLRRAFGDAIRSLRGVGVLPPAVIDELEGGVTTLDPRSAERVNALSALAETYAVLSARVAADVDEHRRRWKPPPRPRRRQAPRRRARTRP